MCCRSKITDLLCVYDIVCVPYRATNIRARCKIVQYNNMQYEIWKITNQAIENVN